MNLIFIRDMVDRAVVHNIDQAIDRMGIGQEIMYLHSDGCFYRIIKLTSPLEPPKEETK